MLGSGLPSPVTNPKKGALIIIWFDSDDQQLTLNPIPSTLPKMIDNHDKPKVDPLNSWLDRISNDPQPARAPKRPPKVGETESWAWGFHSR